MVALDSTVANPAGARPDQIKNGNPLTLTLNLLNKLAARS